MKKSDWVLLVVVLVLMLAIFLMATRADAYSPLTTYTKSHCWTYYVGGVAQWKHCMKNVGYDWKTVNGVKLVKCVQTPTGTFTRYVSSWSATFLYKGCVQPQYWKNGESWHVYKIYKNGVFKGYSDVRVNVTGKYPNVWAWKWAETP